MGALIAAFGGVCLLIGGLGLVAGLRGTTAPPPRPRSRLARAGGTRPPRARRRLRIQAITAVCAFTLVWLFTGWLPSAVVITATVFFLPWLLAPNKAAIERIKRLDALAQWTKRLGDLVRVGTGIEEAINASLRTAPAPIVREVADLAARLQARWDAQVALRAFAREFGDPRADLVGAALALRIRDRGPGLAQVLSDLGATTADVVRRRRDVEADRAKARTTARWICCIATVVIVGISFNRGYVAPYNTAPGVVVLMLLLAAAVGLFTWMHRLGAAKQLPGFLEDSADAAGAGPRAALTPSPAAGRAVAS
ncbi:tight adherence protein B [Kitasatospora sp. MAP12-15]|uniref:type II secretion system F family protein n=1 Tax=unclassified Kitasatospora TaxID=2633591 RepID=UPI00247713FD|nr:type II secretion system F family protein [Kitasatospora sp. MAP12-44]MDH6115646.1 tight adherence protein B [Kitasatospora sp. MAP12-44]